jgi:hypothetical protein
LVLFISKPHHIVRFGPKIVKNARVNFGFASYSGYVDRDGLPHGIGEIVLHKPGYRRGGTYIGEFRNGMKTGLGSILYLDGEPYTGQWVRDGLTGYGYRKNRQGHEYRGEFVESHSHGFGEYLIRDYCRFVGEQHRGLQHGKGINYFSLNTAAVDFNHGILISRDNGSLLFVIQFL